MAFGGSEGGATILDLHSGALSKGTTFVNIFLLQPDIFTSQEFKVYKNVRTKIMESVAHTFGVAPERLHLTHPTFFSRLNDRPAQSLNDEYWHAHVDKETYQSFHYTSLLYLNDFGNDFKGGRFVFIDPDHRNRTIEPKKGEILSSVTLNAVVNKPKISRSCVNVHFWVRKPALCGKSHVRREVCSDCFIYVRY
jgi:hypothetical protein